jgi:hypothetical protein
MGDGRYSCQILIKREFSRQVEKILKSAVIKIPPVGAELSHVDGQEANSRFSQF